MNLQKKESLKDECKLDSVAMIKVSVDLFMSIFAKKYPEQVFVFLLEQLVLVSECDSDSNDAGVKFFCPNLSKDYK
jgi:hypothetical protein